MSLSRSPAAKPARLTGLSIGVGIVLFIQMLFGAWVAGLNAGYAADTWPGMNGRFFPENVSWAGLSTFVNDPFLTHFIHRWWAFVAVIALVVLSRRARALGNRPVSIAIHSAVGVQVLLGIAVVLTGMNITLAVLHQAVGALVVASAAWGMHVLGREVMTAGDRE